MKSTALVISSESKKDAGNGVFSKLETVFVRELSMALKTLKKNRFDLILVQTDLVKKNDFHLLKQIQRMDGLADLLVVLEQSRIPTAMETLVGHWDYLITPYSGDELKLKVEKILFKRNLERENRFWRVELAALLADRGTLSRDDVPAEIWEKAGESRSKDESQSFKRSRKEFEKECLRRALERARGSQTQAAKALGIHRNTLIWKLKRLNLENDYQKIVRKRRRQ
ncbi:MAG TPA: helix-turn-helix domain-containing protein [bacterium]|jgi:DNA-binding NtrC family response regulator|nr:helix-turn-helix domain-containing protein [bacterium]